jgi:hypothetical protein
LERAFADMPVNVRKSVVDYLCGYLPSRSRECQDILIEGLIGMLEGMPDDGVAGWPNPEPEKKG